MTSTILVTGGCGFIGSCFIRRLLRGGDCRVVNLDKLTYAGSTHNIPDPPPDRYSLHRGCVGDGPMVRRLLDRVRPDAVVHFAAESHVDRSIDGPAAFVQTNVVGTATLLEQSLEYFRSLDSRKAESFRFLHVSTDEVYGSLGPEGHFTETTAYAPNSPYAASKAASDMFVRAYHETYGLPTLTTHCSNNYGPYQFPEKLIPLMILHAAGGRELPVYGDGQNVRDWLHVEDHCEAIDAVLRRGRVGQTYNIGGNCEQSNLQVVQAICRHVDRHVSPSKPSTGLIRFVTDRPGHDRRYAIDCTKIQTELQWRPRHTFESGLAQTVRWYLADNRWLSTMDGQTNPPAARKAETS